MQTILDFHSLQKSPLFLKFTKKSYYFINRVHRERLAHPNQFRLPPIYNEAPECLHSSSIIVSFWSVIHSVRIPALEEEALYGDVAQSAIILQAANIVVCDTFVLTTI